jgi:hypothetical protein
MQGKKHYAEKLFTSFQLSNHVLPENFYRRLKSVLDLQWLYKATAGYYGTEGQKSVDPAVFFKLILVGYLENLNSDRKIIAHAKMLLDILFFFWAMIWMRTCPGILPSAAQEPCMVKKSSKSCSQKCSPFASVKACSVAEGKQ